MSARSRANGRYPAPPPPLPVLIDDGPVRPETARMPRLSDPTPSPVLRGAVESLSVTVGSGAVGNGLSTDLAFDFGVLRRRENTRWRLVAAAGVHDGAFTGPFVVSALRSLGEELGHEFVVGRGINAPIGALLPRFWTGALTATVTNRSGGGATLWLTLWIAPAGPADPTCGA